MRSKSKEKPHPLLFKMAKVFTLTLLGIVTLVGGGRVDSSQQSQSLRSDSIPSDAIATQRQLLPHPPHHHKQDSKQYRGCLGLSEEERAEAWIFDGEMLPCVVKVEGTVVLGNSTDGSTSATGEATGESSSGSESGGGSGEDSDGGDDSSTSDADSGNDSSTNSETNGGTTDSSNGSSSDSHGGSEGNDGSDSGSGSGEDDGEGKRILVVTS